MRIKMDNCIVECVHVYYPGDKDIAFTLHDGSMMIVSYNSIPEAKSAYYELYRTGYASIQGYNVRRGLKV